MTERDREGTPEGPVPGLGEIPRAMEAGDLLEERVVRGLRAEGLLASPAPTAIQTWYRRRRWTPAWVVAVTAAGMALFLGGMALGQHQGRRATVELLAAVRDADAADRAAMVQQTGSLYVTALAALARDDDPAAAGPGREAALAALLGAATELSRIQPDDGRIARVLDILREGDDGPPSDTRARRIIWF